MPRSRRAAQVNLKTNSEIELMRQSGKLLTQVFAMLDDYIEVGISSLDIDSKVERFIREELNSRPASKGQYDYPFSVNTSFNEVVCHGMPSAKQMVKPQDILNVDITLEKNGFIADSSKMFVMPDASQQARRLVNVTRAAMWKGIAQVKPGATLGDIGHAIQSHAQHAGFSVVREYCGHGIGREMHEQPEVMHFGKPKQGMVLRPGMIFTIEPMINQGRAKTKTLADGWTVVTADKKLSAQCEHTVLVTQSGVEVLTLRPEESA
ncbi:type I methionyl aminopeptidase [Alginatibacterium sediminis]|uniref:Methionine aminopeptidase n=1 Tax=Alginatibacterium sediminis TaxID=2164068 RepID=A0A420E8E2_9ALTE|nr:type I methionyl aminopeptidase [Alginatibacterium sediminis]RKF15660.1 type I methionyl aminopeptidase [Alginatibacterium sediminis]